MKIQPALALALLAVSGFAPPSVASAPEPSRDSLAAAEAKLDAAEQRWEDARIRDYSYRIRRVCFCPPEFRREVKILVRNGKPRKPPRSYRDVSKVEKLFAVVRDGIEAEAEVVRARYGANGAPRSIYIDRSFMIADEEIGYEIARFRTLND